MVQLFSRGVSWIEPERTHDRMSFFGDVGDKARIDADIPACFFEFGNSAGEQWVIGCQYTR
jgi:hypothetical protein